MKKIEESSTNIWLIAFSLLMVLFIFSAIFLFLYPPLPDSTLGRFTNGFTGGVVSGIGQGFLFLFLSLHMSQLTEARVKISTDILREQADRIERERRILRFEEFLKNGNHYNIRFPDLKPTPNSLGLEYKIVPHRDPGGAPSQLSSRAGPLYIVQVISPAHEGVLDYERLLDYENSPIKDGEYYFCSFFNGAWHISQESVGADDETYRFYMSGRVGEMEYGQTANQFLGFNREPADMRQIFRLLITPDGMVLRDGESADVYLAYVNDQGSTFLKINESPLKKIYLLDQEEAPEDWFLYVENFRGYRTAEYRERVLALIENSFRENGIEPPKVHWYNLD